MDLEKNKSSNQENSKSCKKKKNRKNCTQPTPGTFKSSEIDTSINGDSTTYLNEKLQRSLQIKENGSINENHMAENGSETSHIKNGSNEECLNEDTNTRIESSAVSTSKKSKRKSFNNDKIKDSTKYIKDISLHVSKENSNGSSQLEPVSPENSSNNSSSSSSYHITSSSCQENLSKTESKELKQVSLDSIQTPSNNTKNQVQNKILKVDLPKEIVESNAQSTSISQLDLSNVVIEYKEYESELQMQDIMRLIQAELSEPYSIYTYRYFIYNWPKLCFLAAHGNEYVGAIVCKLDMHMNVVKRGYIAMLAVKKEYRKLKIGTNLVQKAIEAMLADNADEVVLETEMKNIPALRLYENLGFVRDKRLFRYYLNGVDALRLKLWFR